MRKLFRNQLAIFLLLVTLCLAAPNLMAEASAQNLVTLKNQPNIALFVVIEEDLKSELNTIRTDITNVDQNKRPVPNIFHMSVIHLVGHQYTPKELDSLEKTVREIAGAFPTFRFTQMQKPYIDEDQDVLLDYKSADVFVKLQQKMLLIPVPPGTLKKEYEPHSTLYYQVLHREAVENFIKPLSLNTNKKFTANAIGFGVLGERNNLISIYGVYSLRGR